MQLAQSIFDTLTPTTKTADGLVQGRQMAKEENISNNFLTPSSTSLRAKRASGLCDGHLRRYELLTDLLLYNPWSILLYFRLSNFFWVSNFDVISIQS